MPYACNIWVALSKGLALLLGTRAEKGLPVTDARRFISAGIHRHVESALLIFNANFQKILPSVFFGSHAF